MKLIPLSKDFGFAMVDDEDYERVSAYKWSYSHGYVIKSAGGTTISMHRFLMPGVGEIDHEDGNKRNNQRYNLRPASHSQNMQGFRKKNALASSRFRGVYRNKRRCKWQSYIRVAGSRIHLGLFALECDAARAYDTAARKYFGEFASPNFP